MAKGRNACPAHEGIETPRAPVAMAEAFFAETLAPLTRGLKLTGVVGDRDASWAEAETLAPLTRGLKPALARRFGTPTVFVGPKRLPRSRGD